MSLHLDGEPGAVADVVLMPGDPLRARFIADTYLEKPVCYNERRAAYGFTGTYKGRRVSVQASGMGLPSFSIYARELLVDFGAKCLIRIGTCGSFQPFLTVGNIILAQASGTNSAINRAAFRGMDYAPVADFQLLRLAFDMATKAKLPVHVGATTSVDLFYDPDPDWWKVWAEYGVLAAEMETTALYTLTARHRARGLSVLTVSDDLLKGTAMSKEERERTLDEMITLALETTLALPIGK